MVIPLKREYRYLDSDTDRQAVIADIRSVRQAVIAFARAVPADQWYVPRYNGWTLAAMLGHLQIMDKLSLWQVQLGALGISLPLPEALFNQFNDVMSRILKQRVLETTLKGLEKGEHTVTDYIQRLPIGRYSQRVYDPAVGQYLTVEQAVQEFFLYHWRDHFDNLRGAEEQRFVEPPTPNRV
jgi:hypothetical protein